MTGVLIKGGEDAGRSHVTTEAETRDGATSQGRQEPQEPEEAGRTLPQSLQRERGPAHTLISDFWPPGV